MSWGKKKKTRRKTPTENLFLPALCAAVDTQICPFPAPGADHANLHCPVLHFQGTKGAPGQAGPAGEQGMRGPQVSALSLWCHLITATYPGSLIHKDCWDLGIFGCAVAWLSLLPRHSHQPRCDVFAKHPSDTAASASPWIWCGSAHMC